jgi:hypothetical protein
VVVFFVAPLRKFIEAIPSEPPSPVRPNRRATVAPRGWLMVILLVNLSLFCLLFSGKGSIYPSVVHNTHA